MPQWPRYNFLDFHRLTPLRLERLKEINGPLIYISDETLLLSLFYGVPPECNLKVLVWLRDLCIEIAFLLMLWNPHPKPAQSIPDMVNDFPPRNWKSKQDSLT